MMISFSMVFPVGMYSLTLLVTYTVLAYQLQTCHYTCRSQQDCFCARGIVLVLIYCIKVIVVVYTAFYAHLMLADNSNTNQTFNCCCTHFTTFWPTGLYQVVCAHSTCMYTYTQYIVYMLLCYTQSTDWDNPRIAPKGVCRGWINRESEDCLGWPILGLRSRKCTKCGIKPTLLN